MKITATQIDQLYEFTRKHYVEYYDLQTELVDHLANSIESHWEQNPNITFEEALQLEFKKFGVCGFSDVVDERKAALSTKYNKIVWKHFKDFFTFPKIIATFLMCFIVFNLVSFFNQVSFFFLVSILVLFIIGLVLVFYRRYKRNKIAEANNEKKWLFKEIIDSYGYSIGLINLPVQLLIHLDDVILASSPFLIAILSFLLVVFSLFFYIVLFIIPNKATHYLIETYPEYKFAV